MSNRNNAYKAYRCVLNERFPINSFKNCLHCRYQKCTEVGLFKRNAKHSTFTCSKNKQPEDFSLNAKTNNCNSNIYEDKKITKVSNSFYLKQILNNELSKTLKF